MTVPPPTSLRSPGTLLIARSHTASRRSSGQPLFSQAEGTRGSPSLLESSLTFRHDRGARLGMLPATCERPRGLSQSERSGLRARARKRKWSVRYMLCPRVRNRGPWCFLVPYESPFRASFRVRSKDLPSHHRLVSSSLSRNGRW